MCTKLIPSLLAQYVQVRTPLHLDAARRRKPCASPVFRRWETPRSSEIGLTFSPSCVCAQTIPKCKKHPSSRVRVHANSTYSPRTGSTSPTRWAARSLPTYRCARPPPALPVLARLTPLTPPQKISLVCGENCLLESTPLAPSPQSWRPWPHRVSSSPSLCAWLLFCQDSPIGAAFPLARVPATN